MTRKSVQEHKFLSFLLGVKEGWSGVGANRERGRGYNVAADGRGATLFTESLCRSVRYVRFNSK